jgi:UPF0716 family protein affecting phage T7 exclusion
MGKKKLAFLFFGRWLGFGWLFFLCCKFAVLGGVSWVRMMNREERNGTGNKEEIKIEMIYERS